MRRLQGLLCLVILAEVAVLSVRYFGGTLLENLSLSTLESATAEEIRQLQKRIDPASADDWFAMGRVLRAYELLPTANYCYERADKLRPHDHEILFSWGVSLSRMGQFDQAREKMEAAIEHGAENPHECWYVIGRDYLRMENPEAAEPALRNAITAQPNMAGVKLGRWLLRSDRPEEAVRILDEMIDKNPNTMTAHQIKGWAEAALGNDEAAYEHEQISLRCTDRIPKFNYDSKEDADIISRFGIYRLLGESRGRQQRGNLAAAITTLQQAAEISWQERMARQLARYQLQNRDPQGAIATLNDCIRKVGASRTDLELLGVAYMQQGDPQQAKEAWLEAATMQATGVLMPNITVHEKLSEAFRIEGNTDLAKLHKGLQFYEEGKLAWRENQIRPALGFFEKAAKLLDDHAHTWFYLAQARRVHDDLDGARQAYQRCLEIDPNHGRALSRLDHLESSLKSEERE